MNVSFLGYGNMAKALVHCFKQIKGVKLSAASPSLTKGTATNGIVTNPDNQAVVADADIIVLTVKPAKVLEVLENIKDKIPEKALILSVVAGISLKTLEAQLQPQQAIVRCMPNIPIAIGKGATPLIANDYVREQQKQQINTLFQKSGLFVWLKQESDLNPLTALSGSGPAYVCLFLEAMVRAGEKLGLDKELATAFSFQTVAGAIDLLKSTGLSAAELRAQVTSPAGTTEAALSVLIEQGFHEILFNAMQAACERGKALGQNKNG